MQAQKHLFRFDLPKASAYDQHLFVKIILNLQHKGKLKAFSGDTCIFYSVFFFLNSAYFLRINSKLTSLLFGKFNDPGFSCLPVLLGNTTVDELMMRLMAAMEIFSAQQQEDIKDEVSPERFCRCPAVRNQPVELAVMCLSGFSSIRDQTH